MVLTETTLKKYLENSIKCNLKKKGVNVHFGTFGQKQHGICEPKHSP